LFSVFAVVNSPAMDYEEKHWILVEMGVKEHISKAPKQQSKQQR
jgi:hypothetical protein